MHWRWAYLTLGTWCWCRCAMFARSPSSTRPVFAPPELKFEGQHRSSKKSERSLHLWAAHMCYYNINIYLIYIMTFDIEIKIIERRVESWWTVGVRGGVWERTCSPLLVLFSENSGSDSAAKRSPKAVKLQQLQRLKDKDAALEFESFQKFKRCISSFQALQSHFPRREKHQRANRAPDLQWIHLHPCRRPKIHQHPWFHQ